ncbi:hypothetical protein [Sulfurimonas sp.]|nr:hypothetical protein [Sulfurimonas sp.]
MINRLIYWIDRPKAVYTNNLNHLIGELCFWYVVVDVVRWVWF